MQNKEKKMKSVQLVDIGFDLGAGIHPRLEQMKSVRTTFKLSNTAIDTLEKFSKGREITIKETFNEITKYKSILNDLAVKIVDEGTEKSKGVRKTMVISNNALSVFNKVAKEHGISRDSLIELSILLLDKSMKDYLELHQQALDWLNEFNKHGEVIWTDLSIELGFEDPIVERLGYIQEFLDKLIRDIKLEQTDGIPIHPGDFMG